MQICVRDHVEVQNKKEVLYSAVRIRVGLLMEGLNGVNR